MTDPVDQPMLDAITALRERASMLIAEDRHAEAEALLAEIDRVILDFETRRPDAVRQRAQ